MLRGLDIEKIDQLAANPASLQESRFQSEIPEVFADLISAYASDCLRPHFVNVPGTVPANGNPDCLVVGFSINHQANNNQLLNTCNAALVHGGIFLGWTETYQTRKASLKNRYAKLIFPVAYAWDAIWHRFLPKVPILGAAHDWAFGSEQRLMSKVEMIGRLYAAGFELLCGKDHRWEAIFCRPKDNRCNTGRIPDLCALGEAEACRAAGPGISYLQVPDDVSLFRIPSGNGL
jgi:hypothetical protein